MTDNINLISLKESAFSSLHLEADTFLLDDLNVVSEAAATSDDEMNALVNQFRFIKSISEIFPFMINQ